MRVSELQNLVFDTFSLEQKLDIKYNGRPTPILNIVQVQAQCKSKQSFTRKFDKQIYDKNSWICGCDQKNSFFCFICLLFGGDDKWTKEGVNDLKHLPVKITKHENSTNPRDNLVSFKLLGKPSILSCNNKTYAETVRKNNEMIAKNRYVLSKVVDVLKLCGSCNIPLCSQDKSANKGVFLELLDFTRTIDPILNSYLQEATIFNGTAKTIQNEILECMLQVCREHIINEIQNSLFVAVMVDDTTDVSAQTQAVTVLRYELKGKVYERFWGFSNPESQDANSLAKCILPQLNPILKNTPNKLIGHTYDGAAIMGGVSVEIRKPFKNTHFIYCYAHQLSKILEQAVSKFCSVRIFFGTLNGIATFFSHSSDRSEALAYISTHLTSQTWWTCHPGLVQSVFNNKTELGKCFENICLDVPRKYNTETVAQAAGFLKWLEDKIFLFWLNIFNKIMPQVDILSGQLQETDAVKIQFAIDIFEKEIANIKDNLTFIPNAKEEELNANNLNLLAREVCDIIISEVTSRLSFKKQLSGEKLFLREKFKEYRLKLPIEDINTFCEAYPMTINKENLKMEFSIFYSREELTSQNLDNSQIISNQRDHQQSNPGCLQLLNILYLLGLDDAFKEIIRVLKILVTIPMATSETERCFSTLKSIKSFLKNNMGEEKLTALAMIFMEKEMISDIFDFNEKVIEKFIADKRGEWKFFSKNTPVEVPINQKQGSTSTSTNIEHVNIKKEPLDQVSTGTETIFIKKEEDVFEEYPDLLPPASTISDSNGHTAMEYVPPIKLEVEEIIKLTSGDGNTFTDVADPLSIGTCQKRKSDCQDSSIKKQRLEAKKV